MLKYIAFLVWLWYIGSYSIFEFSKMYVKVGFLHICFPTIGTFNFFVFSQIDFHMPSMTKYFLTMLFTYSVIFSGYLWFEHLWCFKIAFVYKMILNSSCRRLVRFPNMPTYVYIDAVYGKRWHCREVQTSYLYIYLLLFPWLHYFLDTCSSRSVLWIWLCLFFVHPSVSIYSFICSFCNTKSQKWLISFFWFFT